MIRKLKIGLRYNRINYGGLQKLFFQKNISGSAFLYFIKCHLSLILKNDISFYIFLSLFLFLKLLLISIIVIIIIITILFFPIITFNRRMHCSPWRHIYTINLFQLLFLQFAYRPNVFLWKYSFFTLLKSKYRSHIHYHVISKAVALIYIYRVVGERFRASLTRFRVSLKRDSCSRKKLR